MAFRNSGIEASYDEQELICWEDRYFSDDSVPIWSSGLAQQRACQAVSLVTNIIARSGVE